MRRSTLGRLVLVLALTAGLFVAAAPRLQAVTAIGSATSGSMIAAKGSRLVLVTL